MRVRVQYTALLAVLTKKRSDELDLADDTVVRELVGLLAQTYGDIFSETVLDMSTGKARFPLLVNGEPATIDSRLQDGDTVVFIMAMSGG